jgi:hypothetical protein
MSVKPPVAQRVNRAEDISTNCLTKFKIDKPLADYIEINVWSTFKEVTIGMLRFNKKVDGDFYCKRTSSFSAYKYTFFQRFFPD